MEWADQIKAIFSKWKNNDKKIKQNNDGNQIKIQLSCCLFDKYCFERVIIDVDSRLKNTTNNSLSFFKNLQLFSN